MKKLTSLSAVCGDLLFVSVCVGLMTAPATLAQAGSLSGKDVRVINTAAEAVPVNVQQLPAVQVSNFPATQQVQVSNSTGNPVPVSITNLPPSQSSGERRMLTGSFTMEPGISGSVVPVWTVPAGKRLLIEFASFQVQDLGGVGVRHYAAVTAGDGRGFVAADGAIEQQEVGSEQLDLFASAGELVAFGLFRDSVGGVQSHVRFTITGTLVDMP